MANVALTHAHLTEIALALYDATDAIPDIRVVRERAFRVLADLDRELVSDLLIFGSCRGIGVEPDVRALLALWGPRALHSAAPRLVEVLSEIAGHA